MKIALVVPGFPKTSETFIVSKFLGLLDKGYDVRMICDASEPQEQALYSQIEWSQVAKRIFINWPTTPHWVVPVLWPFLFFFVVAAQPRQTLRYLSRGWKRFGLRVLKYFYLDANLIRISPDIVHFEFGALAVNRMYLHDLLDCKIVVSFRGYDLNFAGIDRPDFYDEVWKYTDHIHCLGNDLWQRAQRRGCPPNKPHTLIPPAADLEKFQPAERMTTALIGTPERPLRLLSVGRLEWKKGYEYALQAVKQLDAQGLSVEYQIIGSGKYLEAVAFCRHQLGLEHCVTLSGAKPHSEVIEQMRWADIFLHAAVSEGFCNAVIEAQAMKLPVVTSDADGLAENVIDGMTGFVVPRRNSHALAEKIYGLCRDAELRQKMGDAGRKHVTAQFTIDTQLEAFSRLYTHVLDLNHQTASMTQASRI